MRLRDAPNGVQPASVGGHLLALFALLAPGTVSATRASLAKLDAKTRTVFEEYIQDAKQRTASVIGSRTDGCTLYDFVQQRTRPILTKPQGCCDIAPASSVQSGAERPPHGRCLASRRLLISMALYGNEVRLWSYLSTVLLSLDGARRSSGISRMDIVLDVTDKPGRVLRIPAGLNVTHVVHDKDLKRDLPGMYRPRYARALAAGEYDYFMYMNSDINVTAAALDAMCAWQAPLTGTNLMVGMVRWEARGKLRDADAPRKLVNDFALCCPPHIGGAVTIGGRRLMVPTNPHYGAWFLPASRLRCIFDKMAASKSDVFHINGRPTPGNWLEPAKTSWLEYYDGLWLMPWLIRVVPMDDLDDLLVHHLSDRYANTRGVLSRMVDVDGLRDAANRYTGIEPLTLRLAARTQKNISRLHTSTRS